jgi:integrase
MWRDLALFNLAIGSKLRACDLVKLRIDEVCSGAMVRDRATVVQKKTGRPVQFEIMEQTRASLEVWLRILRATGSRYVFPSRLHACPHLSTRQYSRLVHRWVDSIGLKSIFYGTHSMRRTKVTQIYRKLETFVLSSSYSAIQSWRAPSVISGLKWTMLYTSPSKSSSSHRIPPIPGGRLRTKNRTFPENQVLDPSRCLAAC